MNGAPPRLDHRLDDDEIVALQRRCYPLLVALAARYAPGTDIAAGFPDDPLFLDLIRTGWRVDTAPDRADESALVDALGFAFGLLLAQIYGLRWCALGDADGEFLAVLDADGVMLPPFAWVAARARQKGGNVFLDFFQEVAAGMFEGDDG